jgi:hypothetical protein
MNIEERIALNKQKLTGIQQKVNQLEIEKGELVQEALRLDGELRVLQEQEKEFKGEFK